MWIIIAIGSLFLLLKKKKGQKRLLVILLISSIYFHTNGKSALNRNELVIKINNCKKEQPIYLYLVDKKSFNTPFSGIDTVVIKPKGQNAQFHFTNIKNGTYAIRCFQDINRNQKLDKGFFGPSEPWGVSWKDGTCLPFNFEDICFKLHNNKTININLNY
jgi:uncharacterized protein (DUF2141 family)